MATKKIPYVHQETGDIRIVTKSQGKNLPEDYKRVQFVKNKDGKPVMRIPLKHAVVDVFSNGTKEVVEDGNRDSE